MVTFLNVNIAFKKILKFLNGLKNGYLLKKNRRKTLDVREYIIYSWLYSTLENIFQHFRFSVKIIPWSFLTVSNEMSEKYSTCFYTIFLNSIFFYLFLFVLFNFISTNIWREKMIQRCRRIINNGEVETKKRKIIFLA